MRNQWMTKRQISEVRSIVANGEGFKEILDWAERRYDKSAVPVMACLVQAFKVNLRSVLFIQQYECFWGDMTIEEVDEQLLPILKEALSERP